VQTSHLGGTTLPSPHPPLPFLSLSPPSSPFPFPLPPPLSPLLSSPLPLPLEVGPLNPAQGSGGALQAPTAPAAKRYLVHIGLKHASGESKVHIHEKNILKFEILHVKSLKVV